jgi:uncharacterized protein YuzE
MRITYDPVADAACIYLKYPIAPEGVPRSALCDAELTEGAIILGFDSQGRVVQFEILTASKVLPLDVLQAAEHGG